MKTTLYFKNGSSDKVYQAVIKQEEKGFKVEFAYGRRGSTLKTGTKTSHPVTLDEAVKIKNKLIKSKQAKGYIAQEAAAEGVVTSDLDSRSSGIICQLLNPVESHEVVHYITDDNYCAQRKYDGERQLVEHKDNANHAINRKGFYIATNEAISDTMTNISTGNTVVDGESVCDSLMVFDLLIVDGQDIRNQPYRQRLALLETLTREGGRIACVDTAYTTDEKQRLFETLKNEGREGIVFKRLDAPYTAGRPASGGDQVKFKFYETCSVVVTGHNTNRRSVVIEGYQGKQSVPLGNVTIPPNKQIPGEGTVIEVRYLYYYAGGSLYQPQYLKPRTDIDPVECQVNKLKVKRDEAA